MIQPDTQATPPPDIQRPPVPGTVRNAARVMYAGAAVTLIQAVTYLVTAGATKRAIEKAHPHMQASTVNTLTHGGVIVGAVLAVISAILFVWIARSCLAGRNWARATGTVLAAAAVLGAVYNVSAGVATVVLIFVVAVTVIGLAAATLLWVGGSSAWFGYFKRPAL
jgi:hypothetical protein